MIHPMDESWAIAHLKRERDDYKTQRDTLTNDLYWYKEKVGKLEHENERLRYLIESLKVSESVNWNSSVEFEQERNEFEKENKALRLRVNTYFDKWQEAEESIKKLEERNKQMKETIRIEYVIEKDGLYYNDHNNTVKWFDTPFYMDSVFVDKKVAEKFAEEYNANVRKFIITAEVEEN